MKTSVWLLFVSKAYFSIVKNIYESFTHKMAAKASWHIEITPLSPYVYPLAQSVTSSKSYVKSWGSVQILGVRIPQWLRPWPWAIDRHWWTITTSTSTSTASWQWFVAITLLRNVVRRVPRIKLFTPVARIVLCIIYWSAYWRRPFNCRSHPLITNNW